MKHFSVLLTLAALLPLGVTAPASALDENRVLARAICLGQSLAVETFIAKQHPELNAQIPISPQRSLRPLSLAMVCLQTARQTLITEHIRNLSQKPDNELVMLDKLLRFGAQAAYQEPDLEMRTPLHLVFDQAPEIQGEMLKMLLSFDGAAALPLRNREGQTVQDLANLKNVGLARYLMAFQPGALSDFNIRLQPFSYAAASKTLAQLRAQELLIEAYENRRLAEAGNLLEQGLKPDVYLLDPVGRPLLHQLALQGQKDWLELVFKHGINPRSRDYEQREVLHLLSERENADIAWFVERGASVHARDASGESPLFYAVRAGNQAVVKTLIELGAATNLRNHAGVSPLELVIELDQANPVQYRGIRLLLEKAP